MKKWSVRVLASILLAALICAGIVACVPDPKDVSADKSDLELGKGRVSGIVVDKDSFLPEGATAQTYEGASIVIYRAVVAGTYQVSGDESAHASYEAGEMVAQVESEEHGYWQVDLDPGRYFIRAFYGESSYSENVLVDVEEAAILHLRLELLHGV